MVDRFGLLFALVCVAVMLAVLRIGPERAVSETTDFPAIGRITIGHKVMGSTCSGTLVAPDLVLTAAHCVSEANGRAVDPAEIRFTAGWLYRRYVADGIGAQILFARDASRWTGARGDDIALVRLAEPIPVDRVQPIPMALLAEAPPPYTKVAYRGDNPHAPEAAVACAQVWVMARLVALDCPAVPGNSGAPLLAEVGGTWRVVAVIAASAPEAGPVRSLAVIPGTGLHMRSVSSP